MVYNKLMTCNCNQSPCHSCGSKPCDLPCNSPAPFLGISALPDNISVLRFNIDGKRADYDFGPLIQQNQTDTSLVIDLIKRLLVYAAERHTDTITAQDLGAILHLSDIGDVSTKGAANGGMLVYHQDNNCASGCQGLSNTWEMWNALNAQTSTATYPMAFNAEGYPVTLQQPTNPNKQYLLGWDRGNQVSYITPTKATQAPATGGPLYYDEQTGGLVYVEAN